MKNSPDSAEPLIGLALLPKLYGVRMQRRTVIRWIRAGKFPRPDYWFPRAIFWKRATLDAWKKRQGKNRRSNTDRTHQ